ncbi:hypothetical protein H650_17550 [Enterobacter sp. R4-368]|nr:hypothetical protein H650_17550 [Enterobacter sp. R4-368]
MADEIEAFFGHFCTEKVLNLKKSGGRIHF